MSRYLIRRVNGATDGPFSSSQLRELAYEGKLTAADEISPMGETRWVSASKVGGIKEILEMLAPPEANARPTASTPDPVPNAPLPKAQVATQPANDFEDSLAAFDRPMPAVPRAGQARYNTTRHYGMLRFGASSLAAYGWLLMGLSFITAIACSGLVFFGAEYFFLMLILSVFVGFACMLFMRHLAKSTEYAGAMSLLVFLPILAVTAAAIRDGANTMQVFLLYATNIFVVTGSLFSAVVVALFVIALGEYFTAHADIATNSWQQRASV